MKRSILTLIFTIFACAITLAQNNGSSGNPVPYKLSNGVTVYIPSWKAYTLDGKMLEGNGVEPDIEIRTSGKDFKNNDPLIEAVLKMIKN